MSDLTGLAALVTGGGGGIGAAVASELADRGATVAVLDRHPVPETVSVVADVTDTDAVGAAVAEAVRRLGGLDVLVNNAGIGAIGAVSDFDAEEWKHLLDVNVLGIARVTAAALPHLRSSAAAAVVNTASVVAEVGVPQRAAYAASKGAVVALTLAMAADHLEDRIRVNCVLPGTTDTDWVRRLVDASPDPAEAAIRLRDRQPIGRLISAEEVAFAVANLASPRAASTTGSCVTVDGGFSSLRLPR